MKKQVRLSVFVLIAAAVLLASCAGQGSSSHQDRINTTLSALGIADAEFAETVKDPGGSQDGTQVIANGEALIGEEAAVELARAGLQAMEIDTQTISGDAACELTAAENLLIYTVRISFTDGSDNVREYLAGVNAHTGELWREGISK